MQVLIFILEFFNVGRILFALAEIPNFSFFLAALILQLQIAALQRF